MVAIFCCNNLDQLKKLISYNKYLLLSHVFEQKHVK